MCVLTFWSHGSNLVLWYILYKKFWDILSHFSIQACGDRKPTWRSRVRWLAKFAWYDVTWKPSIWLLLGNCFERITPWFSFDKILLQRNDHLKLPVHAVYITLLGWKSAISPNSVETNLLLFRKTNLIMVSGVVENFFTSWKTWYRVKSTVYNRNLFISNHFHYSIV